jgi:hypothetical protein
VRRRRGSRDGWLDASLELRGPEAEALVNRLYDEIAANEIRQRARKTRDEGSLKSCMNCIVANAFRASYFRAQPGVSYFRKRDAYNGSDRPHWLTRHNLRFATDGLSAAGMLSNRLGEWSEWPGAGRCSTFEIRDRLISALASSGISFKSLSINRENAPAILLRDSKGHSLPIDLTAPPAAAISESVVRYNSYVSKQSLDLTLDRDQRAMLESEMRDSAAVGFGDDRLPTKPELYRTNVHRVFNNGSWEQGGRFYGGWWQTIPSKWRPQITINGEPTVELDFSGFSVRAIYHQIGMDYRGDPYTFEELSWQFPDVEYRHHAKTLLQAIINSTPDKRGDRVPLRPKLPRDFRRKLLAAIRAEHGLISTAFGTGEGLRLQCRVSQIAERIMLKGTDCDIVVLPIHDSFITIRPKEGWLRESMNEEYKKEFGFTPIIH